VDRDNVVPVGRALEKPAPCDDDAGERRADQVRGRVKEPTAWEARHQLTASPGCPGRESERRAHPQPTTSASCADPRARAGSGPSSLVTGSARDACPLRAGAFGADRRATMVRVVTPDLGPGELGLELRAAGAGQGDDDGPGNTVEARGRSDTAMDGQPPREARTARGHAKSGEGQATSDQSSPSREQQKPETSGPGCSR